MDITFGNMLGFNSIDELIAFSSVFDSALINDFWEEYFLLSSELTSGNADATTITAWWDDSIFLRVLGETIPSEDNNEMWYKSGKTIIEYDVGVKTLSL